MPNRPAAALMLRPGDREEVERWTRSDRYGAGSGVFTSVKDLNAKIRAFIDGSNDRSHRFVWTKTANDILNKTNSPTTSDSRH